MAQISILLLGFGHEICTHCFLLVFALGRWLDFRLILHILTHFRFLSYSVFI